MTKLHVTEEILIVEDSPTQAELLKFLLEKNDYRVWVAYNGREALDMITKKGKPALVISDIIMPGMDGYELCRCIKNDEKLKDIPFILLTSLSDSKDVLKGLECGADNFITKPYDEKYIFSRVQYILANRLIRERDKMEMGIKMFFGGQEYYITAARQQILDLLISTYETALQKNIELLKVQDELRLLNEQLEKKVEERTASLRAEMDVRKRAEEELCKVNRALKTLSESNRALVRSTDESELIHRICRIIVEIGGYRLAWIGFAQQDESKSVRLAAQYGYETGYLETHNISWAKTEGSAMGRAVITGKSQILRNILTDSNHISLRAEAVRWGYASYIAIPFAINSQPVGVINIYAKEPDAFDEKEVKLLVETADDLAFGVKTLRMRTEHEKAEIEINRQASIIKNIPDSVCTMDLKGSILSWNDGAEKILGYKREEILGKPITIIIPEELAHKELEHCLSILNKEGFFTDYESVRLTKDGRIIPVEITGVALRDENQNITVYASIMKDITERKKADEDRTEKERLEYASKAKSEFLASMSHELRTPLNSILGFSQLLNDGLAGDLNEKQKHFIENINNSGNFLLNLINDILDLSKIEAGKIELNIAKIPLQATVEETITLIKETAMKHNIIIKKEFEPGLDLIEADKQRVKQILFNLLSNAVKFSKEEGGTVTITTRKVDENVQISVRDTGIGIKPENIGKLFQKFEQLDKGISERYGGTGLGLAITKQLVEQHGGRIWVESKYGEGTTFTFMLPLKTDTKEGKQ
ncbi:MAG: ATP-binding protein [Candidatus Methanoperedens sp.]